MKQLLASTVCLVVMMHCVQAQAADILYSTSSPTSWIGEGQTLTITRTSGGTFQSYRYLQQGAYTDAVTFSASASNQSWHLELVGPQLTLVQEGAYLDAERWPFQASTQPGMDFAGNGHGDNTLQGNFSVLEAVYGANGQVQRFAVDFTQYDDEVQTAWVRGQLRYHSDVPLPEPSAAVLLLGCVAAVGSRHCGRQH